MMRPTPKRPPKNAIVRAFLRDPGATAAVEFAIVSSPMIVLMLGLLQMGIYFMAQSALDSGVSSTAETQRNYFYTGTSPTLLTAAQLKTSVTANSGGLLSNNSTAGVEIQPLINLDGALTPIVDGTVNYGSPGSDSQPGSVLVLRAQAQVMNFVPGLSALAMVKSAAIIRRGQY
jgi:Flp pilus assembly protein TadG